MKSKIIIFNILPLTLFALILAVSALVLYEVKKNPSNQNLINSQLIGKKIPTIKIEKIDFFQQKISILKQTFCTLYRSFIGVRLFFWLQSDKIKIDNKFVNRTSLL